MVSRDVREPPERVDLMAVLERQDPGVHRGRMDRAAGPERRVRKPYTVGEACQNYAYQED